MKTKNIDNTLLIKPRVKTNDYEIVYYLDFNTNKYIVEHKSWTEFWGTKYEFPTKRLAGKWHTYVMTSIKAGKTAVEIYSDFKELQRA